MLGYPVFISITYILGYDSDSIKSAFVSTLDFKSSSSRKYRTNNDQMAYSDVRVVHVFPLQPVLIELIPKTIGNRKRYCA